MRQEFYYQPKTLSKSVNYFLWGLLVFGILVCAILLCVLYLNLLNPNKDNFSIIKDLIIVAVPLFMIYKAIMPNKLHDKDNQKPMPMFIFDEIGMVFNHPKQGFEIQWQDIQMVDVSFMYNIPTLVIHTKTKKHKIDMMYFENDENVNIQKVFNEYAMKYSGKKLIL